MGAKEKLRKIVHYKNMYYDIVKEDFNIWNQVAPFYSYLYILKATQATELDTMNLICQVIYFCWML